ncbi:uncharacterized protein LOC115988164 [Quercus lobata]|uniref:uncharacterized protein LOC115988164 n=1 Tax=Quercus lobata TaxID=97700 RepID=UPI001248D776|nr:uncharacterized protein LOC115988164 [Quercus lobata]XP_030967668.1 uncharacterized protein LOC115988164 [Quercus lobata]XP_030967669.1 uncharacterized protein LOC115988164 [Quercus lobata]
MRPGTRTKKQRKRQNGKRCIDWARFTFLVQHHLSPAPFNRNLNVRATICLSLFYFLLTKPKPNASNFFLRQRLHLLLLLLTSPDGVHSPNDGNLAKKWSTKEHLYPIRKLDQSKRGSEVSTGLSKVNLPARDNSFAFNQTSKQVRFLLAKI